MGHHIYNSTADLVCRQCKCKFRIYNGKYRADQVQINTLLYHPSSFVITELKLDSLPAAGIVQITAVLGFLWGIFTKIKIPDISLIRDTNTDCFRSVNSTSATDRKDKINFLIAAYFNSSAHQT